MTLEVIKNVVVALFVAFAGTLVGGMVIRATLSKLYALLTGQLNQAVLENRISAETKDKTVALLNKTQENILTRIELLIDKTEIKDERVIKLLDFYESREQKIAQFLTDFAGSLDLPLIEEAENEE